MKEINDFFEALERLTLLRAPLLLKQMDKVDGTHRQLGRIRSKADRVVNFSSKWSLANPALIQAERYFARETRRSSR